MEKSLSPSDWQIRLIAAEGYLELGMLEDAHAEVGKIALPDQARPEVQGFRTSLFMTEKRWPEGAALAAELVKLQPDCPQWWISYAFCVRRSQSVEAAEAILLEAVTHHPREAMLHFNLACYACVTGRIPEAGQRLKQALHLEKNLRLLALEDEDLEPLWESLHQDP